MAALDGVVFVIGVTEPPGPYSPHPPFVEDLRRSLSPGPLHRSHIDVSEETPDGIADLIRGRNGSCGCSAEPVTDGHPLMPGDKDGV